MRVGTSCAWFVAGVVTLAGCAEHGPAPTTAASGAVAAAPVRTVPPPTRESPAGKMRYFYWEPGVSVADLGADGRARAAAVLASATVREKLGARPGDDFVVRDHDAEKHMFTFRQTREFRGQPVIVADAFASVELTNDTELVYIGTGFQAGIALADAPLTIDEAQAATIAAAAYEAKEKVAGETSLPVDAGLRVEGSRLVRAIHVKSAEDGSRPFVFVVDAQNGDVVRYRPAWRE